MDKLILKNNKRSVEYCLGNAALLIDELDRSTMETGTPKEIALLAGEIYELYATTHPLSPLQQAAVDWAEPRLVDQD